MKRFVVVLVVALLTGCNKSASNPAAPSHAPGSPSSAPSLATPRPVQQELREYAGAGASNCGDLDVRAAANELKNASDCAMQASQGKRAFYVSYEMPGMSVGIAGNAEGKLFTVQSQGGAAGASLTSGSCPSALRVASSGRVTCFAPGDMSSMSGSHSAGSMPAGMSNPHSQKPQRP